jgi:hypothetical protein
LQHFGDDLADAFGGHALQGRDFVISHFFPQPGENPLPPEHHALAAQSPAPYSRREFLNHPHSPSASAQTRYKGKTQQNSIASEILEENVSKSLRPAWAVAAEAMIDQ